MSLYRLELEIELLTDVCLSRTNRTLGAPTTFTGLPGRSLWGAVATRAYRSRMAPEEAFRLFHQGTVRICNGVPLGPGGRGYPTPLAWQVEKSVPGSLNVHNFALLQVRDKLKDTQCKSASPPWVGVDLATLEVKTVYSLRASMDASGRPREGLLFGLPAIRAGTRFWSALVGPETDVDVVARLMTDGELHLGRSRNCELGVVAVRRLGQPVARLLPGIDRQSRLSFLCDSRCLLRSPDTGAPTVIPFPEAFGLSAQWEFAPADSFIRTTRVTHFNSLRKRPETDRFAIEQGCVITFQSKGEQVDPVELAERLEGGIGEHVGQGYGQVVVAPIWLTQEGFTLAKPQHPTGPAADPPSADELYG